MAHGVLKTHDDDKNATEKTKKMSNTKDIRQYGPHQKQVVSPGPSCKTEYRKESFLPRTITDWDKLPENIINSTSLDSFKSSIP
jgi:hypothetical protein